MGSREVSNIGKRGTVVVPATFRRRFGMEEGVTVTIEEREDGVSLHPAVALPAEVYTPEREAELPLKNAATSAGYRWAGAEDRRMVLDPKRIRHDKPPGA